MKAVDREQEPFRILGSSLSRPTHREDERVDLSSGRRRRGNISQRRQRHCHPPQFNSHRGGRVEDLGGEELREALVSIMLLMLEFSSLLVTETNFFFLLESYFILISERYYEIPL